jgi:hypothetical protein
VSGTWCGACWKPVCTVECQAHANAHGLTVAADWAAIKKLMHGCNQSNCTGKAVWKCDGCHKGLCANHQQITNHNCTVCHYCGASANGVCDGCGQYSCCISGCAIHRQRCSALRTALANPSKSSFVRAKMKQCGTCDVRGMKLFVSRRRKWLDGWDSESVAVSSLSGSYVQMNISGCSVIFFVCFNANITDTRRTKSRLL